MHTKHPISFIITKELVGLKEHLFIPHYFLSEGHGVHTELSGGTNTQEVRWYISCLDAEGLHNYILPLFSP